MNRNNDQLKVTDNLTSDNFHRFLPRLVRVLQDFYEDSLLLQDKDSLNVLSMPPIPDFPKEEITQTLPTFDWKEEFLWMTQAGQIRL